MNQFWAEILSFCQTITNTVGDRLIADAGKLQATNKEDGSLVTKADRWADRTLRDAIISQFRAHGVLTEETEHLFPNHEWCWIVDPIDGTNNFTRGVPLWTISLGLLYQGTPVFGFVYLPPLQQSFYGYWYGNSGLTGPMGAYMNSSPIHTSLDEPSKNHLFSFSACSLNILKQPFPCRSRMMGVGSYNLLLVATGAALGAVEATPKIWDIAAALVIVKAAGGEFIFLEDRSIFPLEVGQDYSQISLPCVAVSKAELVPLFLPLVMCVKSVDS